IQMARPAFHEQEDNAFRLGREVLRLGGQRIDGCRRLRLSEKRIVTQEIAERQRPKPRTATQQHLTACVGRPQLVIDDGCLVKHGYVPIHGFSLSCSLRDIQFEEHVSCTPIAQLCYFSSLSPLTQGPNWTPSYTSDSGMTVSISSSRKTAVKPS